MSIDQIRDKLKQQGREPPVTTIAVSPETRDKIKQIAKMYKTSQSNVIDVIIRSVYEQLTQTTKET